MSLVPCKGCGKLISKQAKSCPGCGHRNMSVAGAGCRLGVAFLLAIFAVIMFILAYAILK